MNFLPLESEQLFLPVKIEQLLRLDNLERFAVCEALGKYKGKSYHPGMLVFVPVIDIYWSLENYPEMRKAIINKLLDQWPIP